MPSAAPPPETGEPRSELEQLQLRAGQVTDEVNIFELSHSKIKVISNFIYHLRIYLKIANYI